jgi:hypothetical protein
MLTEFMSQLRFQGLRYRLGLASCLALRQAADAALNAGIYSPSLVDAALDADEHLSEIGSAFEKALDELAIRLPETLEDCCWALLQCHISQIASGETTVKAGLAGIMEVYYGCNLYEQSNHYVGDSYDIHYLIGDYWGFDELIDVPGVTYKEMSGQDASAALEADVVIECKAWLNKHAADA